MSGMMWFGPRNHEQWIPMPTAGAEWGKSGWTAKMDLLNGGKRIKTSRGGSRQYPMTWAPTTRDALRHITDTYDGVYDESDATELVYFVSPDSADKNAAPQHVAFPAQSDGMPLIREARPALEPTAANALGYPARSAVYTFAGTETAVSTYIPIPPGYTAWVGAHGSATGDAGYGVTPFSLTAPGATDELTLLAVTDTTRVNASYSSDDYTGIELAVIADAGTLTLAGVIVQVLRTGVTPATGGYISGQGNGGCLFDGAPETMVYTLTSGIESVGMSATLVEVGPWL